MKKSRDDYSADVQIWLEFAEYDLKTAKWNLEGNLFTSTCYCAQQAAEKALKALILTKGHIIPKVHSLDRLISELHKLQVETADIKKPTLRLDAFYISTRYPGEYGGPSGLYNKKDAKNALKSAEEIIVFVKGEIKVNLKTEPNEGL